jgi:hypothetical protein
VMYKNSNRPHYFRGTLSDNDQFILADNNQAVMFAYEAIMRNGLTVGWSRNAEIEYFVENPLGPLAGAGLLSNQPVGVRLYDGPLNVRDMLFSGFPSRVLLWNVSSPFDDGQGIRFTDVTPRVLDDEPADNRLNNVSRRACCVALWCV